MKHHSPKLTASHTPMPVLASGLASPKNLLSVKSRRIKHTKPDPDAIAASAHLVASGLASPRNLWIKKAKRKPSTRWKKERDTIAASRIVASGEGSLFIAAPSQPAKKTRRKAVTASQESTPLARTRRAVKGRLLWIGDAAVPTGFATVTHEILAHLHPRWDITVSGVNYDGRAHPHPYPIQPAWQGEDMWGLGRFAHLCAEFAPDAVVINSDWWNVAAFLERAPRGLPIVAYMPVDGANVDRAIARKLRKLHAAVWYTDFGFTEASKSGFRGKRHVIPHGINAALFRPVDRALAREALGLPEDAFIIGNVNRNQPRKRLDLTLRCFAEWTRRHRVRDARLLLHCARNDTGWDLGSLAAYHGIADRVIFTGSEHLRDAAGTARLPLIYSALDVQLTTTLGEGWGLTTMEGMACGVPQIVPDWAALGEWAGPAVKIPCSTHLAHPEINTIGALPDMEPLIAALDALYRDPARRAALGSESAQFVRAEGFRWKSAATAMEAVIESVIHAPRDVRRPRRAPAATR